MKKIITLILVFTMLFSTVAMADNTKAKVSTNEDNITSVEFTFDYSTSLKESDTNTFKSLDNRLSLDNNSVKIQEAQNIENVIAYIKKSDLSKLGYSDLEQHYIDELNSCYNDDAVLTGYRFEIPSEVKLFDTSMNPIVSRSSYSASASSTGNYYGTYGGLEFRYYISVKNLNYSKEIGDSTLVQDVIKGAVNVAMCFGNLYVGIPYAILSSIPDDYTTHHSDYIEYKIFEEISTRHIITQDVNNNSSQYLVTALDMSKLVRIETLVVINDPRIGTKSLDVVGPKRLYTDNYFNKTHMLSKAYYAYVQNDLYVESIPQAILSY